VEVIWVALPATRPEPPENSQKNEFGVKKEGEDIVKLFVAPTLVVAPK
jgi:hypothetical protein